MVASPELNKLSQNINNLWEEIDKRCKNINAHQNKAAGLIDSIKITSFDVLRENHYKAIEVDQTPLSQQTEQVLCEQAIQREQLKSVEKI